MNEIKTLLENYIIENIWDSCNELCRAFFTTLCCLTDWQVNMSEVDQYLMHLYDYGDIESCDIDFEEFYAYMTKLII